MAELPFLLVVPQRHESDCGVACLAMLLGASYEVVIMAFRHNVMAHGCTIQQLLGAGRRLGKTLRWTRKVNLETDTGILSVRIRGAKREHVVLLKEDLIIDTDSTVWDAETYIKVNHATVLSIVKLVE